LRPLAVAVVALAGGAASCQQSLSSSLLPEGTYALVLVDDSPLPYRGTSTITLGGALALQSKGQYSLTQTDSAISGGGGVTQFNSQGTWTLNENALVLRDGGTLYLGVAASLDTLRVNLTVGTVHTNTYVRR